jgi:hypothetical protein
MPGRLLGDRDGARPAAPRGRRPWGRHACGSPGRDEAGLCAALRRQREGSWRSARACLTLMVRDPSVLRSDDTDARYRQGAQGTDTEHVPAGSRQTAKATVAKPA